MPCPAITRWVDTLYGARDDEEPVLEDTGALLDIPTLEPGTLELEPAALEPGMEPETPPLLETTVELALVLLDGPLLDATMTDDETAPWLEELPPLLVELELEATAPLLELLVCWPGATQRPWVLHTLPSRQSESSEQASLAPVHAVRTARTPASINRFMG
jgi:hypothetical protein